MSTKSVLVVGAGIGGLAAAAALGQRGHAVTVIDVKPDATVLGVGINQPGNSLRALDALGVLDEVLAAGYAYEGNDYCDLHENRVVYVRSTLGDGRVPANSALSRGSLHLILKRAAERAGAVIRYATTVAELVDDGDAVEVEFSDGTAGRYDAVVAFDGARSPMRKRLWGDAFPLEYTGFGIWRVQLPRPARIDNCYVYQGYQRKAGLVPLSESEMYMFLVTPEPDNPHYDAERFDEILSEKLAGYTGIMGEIRDGLEGNRGIVYTALNEIMKPLPWHSGRVIVLGDAVHATAPHLTQGAGMALEDAVVLADELSRGRPVVDSLERVGELRYERAKLVSDASHAILENEMQITEENFAAATAVIRENMGAQTAYFEGRLNLPFRGVPVDD